MQYVGRFVSTVYNTITPNINPATLSGAIDVIVVEREVEVEEDIPEDELRQAGSTSSALGPASVEGVRGKRKVRRTELASTPFHVRFGKMSVLRPGERKVTLHLNDGPEPLPFAMKIGEQGEAFFVVEVDDETERSQIPDDLVTSPILSATTSPLASPGLAAEVPSTKPQGLPSTTEVEPLYLDDAGGSSRPTATSELSDTDEARSLDSNAASQRSKGTADTTVTTPRDGASPSEDPVNPDAGSPADDAELGPVPKDSGLSGSGPEAGPKSLLGQLGTAASNVGGAVGAVGRAVGVKADNPRLDKLAEQASKSEGPGQQGAPVDQNKETAHEYDPQTSNPPGKQRQQKADDKSPPDQRSGREKDAPVTETDSLEQKMKDEAEQLIHDGEAVLADKRRRQAGSETAQQSRDEESQGDGCAEGEEAYPAPFGERSKKAHTHSGAEVRESLTNTFPVAQSEHQLFLAGRKMPRGGASAELGVEPTQIDARTIRGRIRAHRRSSQTGQTDEENDGDGEHDESRETLPAASSSMQRGGSTTGRRKEDLQYLFDMDGYKMTTDGEDLAFAEGHRLAQEMPLSRRHGGNEIHPHIGELLDQAHRRERESLMGSTAGKDVSSVEGASSGDAVADPEQTTSTLSTATGAGKVDDLTLEQDLLRLAHALSTGRSVEQSNSQSVDTLPFGRPSDAESSRKRVPRTRRQVQDVSLSDTEADRPGLDDDDDEDAIRDAQERSASMRKHAHHRAKSGPFDLEMGHAARNNLPGDATPPHRSDSIKQTQSDGTWRWGEPGQRHRVLSSAAADDVRSFDQSGTTQPQYRFSGLPHDPYIFEARLNDAVRTFQLSLCYKEGWGQSEDDAEEREEFQDGRISFQRFLDDPDVVNDERLVVQFDGRFLTWENSSSLLATLFMYRATFAAAGADESCRSHEDSLPRAQEPRASVWSRWWNRNRQDQPPPFERESSAPPERFPGTKAPMPIERVQSDTALLASATVEGSSEGATNSSNAQQKTSQKPPKTFAKTLRLTSDQLKSLNLKKGANNITFSVTSSYSGVATCTARIFLWEGSHQIVVSDIDGTITKSDALGHVFTIIGRDWTHLGVAKLYTDIARNGYRIMYLTSRAIGQADTTRDYLKGINQNNYRLPDGPVIMSPDRLIASLHREVILRKPEVFKMACLRDIARLFGADPRKAHPQQGALVPHADPDVVKAADGPGAGHEGSPSSGAATAQASKDAKSNEQTAHPTPFYAGFGNRITDALSYRSVNIPSSRIFTIDTNGEVKMELLELAGYKSSYIHMTDLVDQMFPPITQRSSEKKVGKPEYNDFNYWRPSVAEFELPTDDELMPTPPLSPALSARSGRSVRSVAGSVRSATSGGAVASDNEQQQQSRLSRFGLGSLGLSRKGSVQTIAASETSSSPQSSLPHPPTHSASTGDVIGERSGFERAPLPGARAESARMVTRATSVPLDAVSDGGASSSYGSATPSWMAPWRRRAASPGAGPSSPPQATSPLVGPVITADPDSDEDEDGEEYGDDDDDVSSFEDDSQDEDGSGSEQGSRSDGEAANLTDGSDREEADGGQTTSRPIDVSRAPQTAASGRVRERTRQGQRGRRSRRDEAGAGGDLGDHALDEDVDELLASGEVHFDWRG
ncbi:unnamed protein product [Parajaminaea phylloscopi]